jgi:CRP-like cAMP-binding protein
MQQDMKIFLKLLSPSLRSTILFHLYKTIISKIPIFDQCSNIELRFIVNYMKTVIFLPGDEVIRQGDKGSKIYFISRGKVEVYIGADEIIDNLSDHFKRMNSKNSQQIDMKSYKGSI